MSEGNRDRQLGMGRRITRRDFLNGVAVGIGALGCASLPDPVSGMHALTAGADTAKNYPPALTDLRGSAPGSFDVAHALRDGTFWDNAGNPAETQETYDLVVVGGGISGLAAAYF
jgi:spermidine dehydrogenase